MKYRPEIDGLRAIAVSSVLIYHANFTILGVDLLPGGYLGVDIFFVISGYLITNIILNQLKSGNFSIIHFYERRIRRIFPALLVVLIFSSFAASRILIGDSLKDYFGSLTAAVLSLSNFWFWLSDNYFTDESSTKPLLHTWSLGVEEQFYVILPILLIFLYRYAPNKIGHAIIGLASASLVVSQLGSTLFPSANFFLLPSRAWELMAGAALAHFLPRKPHRYIIPFRSALPAIGIGIVLTSMILFNSETSHPSFLTLLPVIGTMLFIHYSNSQDTISRILSAPIPRFVGLISFSLYLWHFPIFAFATVYMEPYGAITTAQKIPLLMTTFALSVGSYYLVEKPARSGTLVSGKIAVSVTCSIAILLAVLGLAVHQLGNILTPPANLMLARVKMGSMRASLIEADGTSCHSRDISDLCTFVAKNPTATVVGLGDSFIDVIGSAIKSEAEANNWTYIHDSQSACPWIPDMVWRVESLKDDAIAKRCNDITGLRYRFLKNLRSDAPKYVVFHMSNSYGERVGHGQIQFKGGRTFSQAIRRALTELDRLGFTIVLVYPVPPATGHVPRMVAHALQNYETMTEGELSAAYASLNVPLSESLERTRAIRRTFDSFTSTNLIRIDPFDIFCSAEQNVCHTNDGVSVFYADKEHVSDAGGELLGKKITEAIREHLQHRSINTDSSVVKVN